MDELNEKLLLTNTKYSKNSKTEASRNKHRLTVMYEHKQPVLQSSFDFQIQDYQDRKKRYYSIVEQPQFVWNSQEILQRSMIMDDKQHNIQLIGQAIVSSTNQLLDQPSEQKTDKKSTIPIINQQTEKTEKKKELNHRIFSMKKGPMLFIYFLNLFFNIGFRLGLVILLVYMFEYGDGDQNQKQEKIFVSILLGLEGIVALLYFLAITKILYTKSSDISVYFQKQFYQKPYAQIHMQRILRKHFTLRKIVSNLCRLANPFTKFSKDIKISVLRQQIYKRIQLVFVFIPLCVSFITGLKWFDKTQQMSSFDVQLLMAILVCMEAVHLIVHYLLVYIFS